MTCEICLSLNAFFGLHMENTIVTSRIICACLLGMLATAFAHAEERPDLLALSEQIESDVEMAVMHTLHAPGPIPDDWDPIASDYDHYDAVSDASVLKNPSFGVVGYGHGYSRWHDDVDSVLTIAPNDNAGIENIPQQGQLRFVGEYSLDHVSLRKRWWSGRFVAGDEVAHTGTLTIDVDLDAGRFTGIGQDEETGAEVVFIGGRLDEGRVLNGTLRYGGIDSNIYGTLVTSTDPYIYVALLAAFGGSTTTDMVIGGFLATNY